MKQKSESENAEKKIVDFLHQTRTLRKTDDVSNVIIILTSNIMQVIKNNIETLYDQDEEQRVSADVILLTTRFALAKHLDNIYPFDADETDSDEETSCSQLCKL